MKFQFKISIKPTLPHPISFYCWEILIIITGSLVKCPTRLGIPPTPLGQSGLSGGSTGAGVRLACPDPLDPSTVAWCFLVDRRGRTQSASSPPSAQSPYTHHRAVTTTINHDNYSPHHPITLPSPSLLTATSITNIRGHAIN